MAMKVRTFQVLFHEENECLLADDLFGHLEELSDQGVILDYMPIGVDVEMEMDDVLHHFPDAFRPETSADTETDDSPGQGYDRD